MTELPPPDISDASETAPAPEATSFVPIGDQVDAFKRVIEAIVLVAHDPVPADLLAQLLEQPTSLIDSWCDEIAESYIAARNGFEFARVAGGFRYQTASDLTPYVERFLLHDQRARLSGAALETLAIVAYKQPISRAQVGAIRGVDPDGVLRTLQARGYIDEVGRDDGPGQAILFGTTPTFLEKLGLESLDDLPSIAEFIPGADVIELLEHGLRVTPEIEVAPTAVPHATLESEGPVGEEDLDDTDHSDGVDDAEVADES
jgi:segregation and condensation protein B